MNSELRKRNLRRRLPLSLTATLASLGITAGVEFQSLGSAGTEAASPRTPGPRIQFAQPAFEFGKVESGQVVEHEFVFTNRGDQLLEIREVRPTCGCTIAGPWDRQVPPGGSGKIPVRFNSANSDGAVGKTIIVVCNDPAQTNITLQLTGRIWRPIEANPPTLVFAPSSDNASNQVRVVRIVNNTDEPVTLAQPESANPALRFSLRPVKPGKEIELEVTFAPPRGFTNSSAPITMKTSCSRMAVLSITTLAIVEPAVTATPAQVTLPGGPLPAGATANIVIQRNGAGPLALSDPHVNAPGVEALLRETQPGRWYILTLKFPAGFQAEPGQNVEAQVKSNHPQFPVIRIPILQGRANLEQELKDGKTKSGEVGADTRGGSHAAIGSRHLALFGGRAD